MILQLLTDEENHYSSNDDYNVLSLADENRKLEVSKNGMEYWKSLHFHSLVQLDKHQISFDEVVVRPDKILISCAKENDILLHHQS